MEHAPLVHIICHHGCYWFQIGRRWLLLYMKNIILQLDIVSMTMFEVPCEEIVGGFWWHFIVNYTNQWKKLDKSLEQSVKWSTISHSLWTRISKNLIKTSQLHEFSLKAKSVFGTIRE